MTISWSIWLRDTCIVLVIASDGNHPAESYLFTFLGVIFCLWNGGDEKRLSAKHSFDRNHGVKSADDASIE